MDSKTHLRTLGVAPVTRIVLDLVPILRERGFTNLLETAAFEVELYKVEGVVYVHVMDGTQSTIAPYDLLKPNEILPDTRWERWSDRFGAPNPITLVMLVREAAGSALEATECVPY